MKKIRFGNDIPIEWAINRNDQPEDFTGKTLRLTMIGTSGTTEVTDYTIEGNVLRWMFWGKDQHKPSTYHFCLVENGGEEGMFTIDACDVLKLVNRSCAADDCDGPFTMQVASNIDDKGVTCSSVITVPANGLSAYEIAVRHGFEGTEEEWLASLKGEKGEPFTYDDFTPEQIEGLKKPALDAAAVAEAAADAATKAAANADNVAKTATEAASSANDAADRAGQAAVDAGLAKTAAEEAAVRATEAAGAAGSAAEEASSAAEAASQTNTEVSTAEQGRVTAEEQRVAAEQTRQTEFSQLKQDAQTATQEANAAAQAANQAAESIEESFSAKQDKTDDALQTTDKTVTGAINEVNQALKTKQPALTPGNGIEITPENTINVTLDTTVFKVVASLPESPAAGDENKIHLVPAESTEEGNIYTEYVFVNGKWEEFGTYKSEVDLTPYLKKVDAEATYQKITDNTLATTAKTIVGAINEVKSSADTNTGNITRIDKAVGNPVIEEVDLSNPDETGVYWNSNTIKTTSSIYAIKLIDLLAGEAVFCTVYVGTGAFQIAEVNADDTEITGKTVKGDGAVASKYFIADKDCKVAISYNNSYSHEAFLIKSPFNTAISDNSYMQYLHKVYEEYGAVYNKETGYWEYGDLKDMTEEDCFLAAFYALEQIQGEGEISFILDRYRNSQARTYFTKIYPKGGYNNTNLYLNSCFAQNSKLEYLKLSTSSTIQYLYINNIVNAFRYCSKLRKIEDILTINNADSLANAFVGCVSLRDVKIRYRSNANKDVSFQDSPLLSYESIKYLVDNAANTAAITVTVHPTTYSYLTGTTPPTTEVGGTTEEWQALVTTAQGKQISFAVPEETQSEVTE